MSYVFGMDSHVDLAGKFGAAWPHLDERARRIMAASEAMSPDLLTYPLMAEVTDGDRCDCLLTRIGGCHGHSMVMHGERVMG